MQRNRSHRGRTRYVIACIIGLCFLNDLFVWPTFEQGPEPDGMIVVIGLVLGTCFGQLNLISVWAAISAGSPIIRLPWAALLVVLMWTAIVVGARLAGVQTRATVTLGVILAACCVVAQIPLWIASRSFGWRLLRLREENLNEVSKGSSDQFDLREMFLGTVLLAVALAGVRRLLPEQSNSLVFSLQWEFWVLLPILIVVNLATVLPAIWAAFFVRVRAMILGVYLLTCGLLAVVEVAFLQLIFGSGKWSILMVGFAVLNAAQIGVVFVVLKVLSSVGFRLVRHRSI